MTRANRVSYSLAKDVEYGVWYVLASAEGLTWVVRSYTDKRTASDDYDLYIREAQ